MDVKWSCTHSDKPCMSCLTDGFLQLIVSQGYSRWSVKFYRRLAKLLCRHMAKRGLSAQNINEDFASMLLAEVVAETPKKNKTTAVYGLERFRDYLIEHGDAPPRVTKVDMSPRACLRREYQSYLKNQRALSDSTIQGYLHFFDRFFTHQFGDALGDPEEITPDDITSFMVELGNSEKGTYKTLSSDLRNLFRFLFWNEWTSRDLSKTVPKRRLKKHTNIPRYITPDGVNLLLEAARRDSRNGRRNYAMLLTMARLGLRLPEVFAIDLDDIHWRAGEILVRGKGLLHDRMPLTVEVGEALVDYIRHERRGSNRALFVMSKAPFRRFNSAARWGQILNAAYGASGVSPPRSSVGSHVFRHSLATDMLHNGASLDEIGQVLRHRSRMTTTIYAKHDVETLRSLTRSWPGGESAQ